MLKLFLSDKAVKKSVDEVGPDVVEFFLDTAMDEAGCFKTFYSPNLGGRLFYVEKMPRVNPMLRIKFEVLEELSDGSDENENADE
ncbi:hypothetical protein G3578_09235 [Brevibacillus sp. SYP-B805]|uniref:hypothetical protein n=1 Tax=Brevibacillus sp. SYP-B805 TaxID=1578199 RepID=UPI0013EE03C9|nr:hypothetical protein [Brevibacillus sp. SYP-B805]NGQ95337.1 hypothetical protein [Brevibacillus sp. SYP-B805]